MFLHFSETFMFRTGGLVQEPGGDYPVLPAGPAAQARRQDRRHRRQIQGKM